MTLIPFTWTVDGTLTNATSVVMSDPTGTYGLKRTDTDEVLVVDGTALTNLSPGVYQYNLTDPESGLSYDYWIEVFYLGQTYYFNLQGGGSDVPESIDLGTYTFTSREEIERLYSTLAVNLRIDDLSSANQTNMFNDLVNAATSTVASYTMRYYNNADLVNSSWVRRRATIIGAYYLSMRRANGTQFGLEYQRIIEELEKFLTSTPPFIPDDVGGLVPIRSAAIPTVSRQIVDDRYRTDKLRRVPSQSTKPYPGAKDYTIPFTGQYS